MTTVTRKATAFKVCLIHHSSIPRTRTGGKFCTFCCMHLPGKHDVTMATVPMTNGVEQTVQHFPPAGTWNTTHRDCNQCDNQLKWRDINPYEYIDEGIW